MIKEFRVNLKDVDYEDYQKNPLVFLNYDYQMTSVIGKAVHFSRNRGIINVRFWKGHRHYKLIKDNDIQFDLDVVIASDYLSKTKPVIALVLIPRLPK